MSLYVVILIMCQHHFQSRENGPCHVLCSSCPYFEVGVARTVPNSHVIAFCSIPLVFSKLGLLRTVNGAAPVFLVHVGLDTLPTPVKFLHELSMTQYSLFLSFVITV